MLIATPVAALLLLRHLEKSSAEREMGWKSVPSQQNGGRDYESGALCVRVCANLEMDPH